MSIVIAMDGPSGSGKSTVARKIAQAHGLSYLDTGAMYRAVAWWALHQGIDLNSGAEVVAAAQNIPLELSLDPLAQRFVCDGIDITQAIREPDLSKVVSLVAVNLDLRKVMLHWQQSIIQQETMPDGQSGGRGIVAEGRDITTVVAPDADVRVLLTASEEARLARRAKEVRGSDDAQNLAATRDEVVRRDAMDATVSQFMTAADGVHTIDSSHLNIEEVVEIVNQLIAKHHAVLATSSQMADEAEEAEQAQMLKSFLGEYELEPEDLTLLEDNYEVFSQSEVAGYPVLAIVGRPNVGKSTLVNRIVGKRVAVVQDEPGVTRDRVRYEAHWNGRPFTVVDTGGWELEVSGIDKSVALQSELAIAQSDAVLLVVDATVGITDTDEQIVRLLRKSGKPVVLAANKVDSFQQEADAALLWNLGLGQPFPVSALHGRGTGDLLDQVMKELPLESAVATKQPKNGPRRIALLGRPNVGKSSLLNKLAGENRVVVDPLAGTTRDPVDELIELDDRIWTFVDTAGIRRRVHQTRGADYYASLRTQGALAKAELGLALIDASQELTEQDIRVMQQIIDSGRAMVVVCNKWDLVDEERRYQLDRELERELVQMQWAERVNLSALTGWHTNRLTRAMDTALASWDKRISTGKLNAFLGELVAAKPHPVRSGKQPRILFAAQVANRPPKFVLFTSGFLDHGYRRFIERRLREGFGFSGSPIQISVRVREKRKRK